MQFSIDRFLLLLRKRWVEYGRSYLLGLAILAGFWGLSLSLFILQGNGSQNLQSVVLILGLGGGGALFAYHQFQQLSTAPGAIRFLHLPGSHLEKTGVAFALLFAFFLPAGLAVFYGVDAALVEIARHRWWQDPNDSPMQILHWDKTRDAVFVFAIASAIFALGAVYFQRAALVKTGVTFFVLCTAILILNAWLPYWLVPHSKETLLTNNLFESIDLYNKRTFQTDTVPLPAAWQKGLQVFLAWLVPAYCWFITLVRLRERQV